MHHVYAGLVPALWFLWGVYWLVASRGMKPTVERESWTSRLGYLVPIWAGVWLLVAPHPPGAWLNARLLPRGPGWFWLGAVLVAAGLLWACWGRIHLGRNWSGIAEVKQDHELIRSGPYRWTRHPIYTGLLLAFLGSAVVVGEWRGLVALVLLTVAAVRKLGIEERLMMARFPAPYARYRAEVPALVPWRLFTRIGRW